MTKSHALMAGIALSLPLFGCTATSLPLSESTARRGAPAVPVAKRAKTGAAAPRPVELTTLSPHSPNKAESPASAAATKTAAVNPKKIVTTPSLQEPLAVLRVEAGALITQVNGDPKVRCTRPDCRLPLAPGTHRITVLYQDTTVRAGSRVTYASMYPRVVELTLEPGHHYALTAAGRYSQKWWVSVEDQTTNKIVYDDRETSE